MILRNKQLNYYSVFLSYLGEYLYLVYEFIHLVVSRRPRIHGLPKVHKQGISSAAYSFYVPFSSAVFD